LRGTSAVNDIPCLAATKEVAVTGNAMQRLVRGVARQSSSGRQPNFAAAYKECNYGTFAEGVAYIRLGGHHVGHRPIF